VTTEAVVEAEPLEAASAVRTSSLIRAVNKAVREAGAPFDAAAPIGFICECRRSGCFAVCWLTAAEFDACVISEDWILVSDHVPSEPSPPRDDQAATSAPDAPQASNRGVADANDLTRVADVDQALIRLAVGRSQSVV
jgi:hypothetical protein